jgi:alkylation response protein AidB-like acyl-CoA dehydrogenase
MENALIVEEFCRRDSGIGSAVILSDFSSEVIMRFGSEAQKKAYLPKIASGEYISGGGYTEPDHGSDITFMNTTAVRDGDTYVINGSKTFITNGGIAQFLIVLCQTDEDASPPYRGQSTFIVPTDVDGFEAVEIEDKMGLKMTSTAEIYFNNVRIPADALIGEEGKGFYQVLEFFDESRVEIAAQALGIAQGALDRTVAYIKERSQFGRKIAAFQVNQHKIADMATRVELARLMVYKAAWNYDKGRIDPTLTSMAKMTAGQAAVYVADEAIQMHGGYGYIMENEVERFYRDAKITEIYEGTREIQKNTISSGIVGRFK